MVLRPAAAADVAQLATLPGLSASTRRGLSRGVSRSVDDARGDTVVLAATATPAGGEVVGAAFGLLQVDDGHVIDLAVAPAARRSGIGSALLSALTGELRTRGARAVTLEVRAGNHGALALYRAAGFVVEGRRGGYYPDGEDALLLWQHAGSGHVGDRVTTAATATVATTSMTITTGGG